MSGDDTASGASRLLYRAQSPAGPERLRVLLLPLLRPGRLPQQGRLRGGRSETDEESGETRARRDERFDQLAGLLIRLVRDHGPAQPGELQD